MALQLLKTHARQTKGDGSQARDSGPDPHSNRAQDAKESESDLLGISHQIYTELKQALITTLANRISNRQPHNIRILLAARPLKHWLLVDSLLMSTPSSPLLRSIILIDYPSSNNNTSALARDLKPSAPRSVLLSTDTRLRKPFHARRFDSLAKKLLPMMLTLARKSSA